MDFKNSPILKILRIKNLKSFTMCVIRIALFEIKIIRIIIFIKLHLILFIYNTINYL